MAKRRKGRRITGATSAMNRNIGLDYALQDAVRTELVNIFQPLLRAGGRTSAAAASRRGQARRTQNLTP